LLAFSQDATLTFVQAISTGIALSCICHNSTSLPSLSIKPFLKRVLKLKAARP
jgi:hypothetical protein